MYWEWAYVVALRYLLAVGVFLWIVTDRPQGARAANIRKNRADFRKKGSVS
jgi:hypothetical protein